MKGRSTALIEAVRSRNVDVVNALLDAGANVNLRNCYGYTPLVYSVSLGYQEITEVLLAAGAHTKLGDYTILRV